jgi:long-chain fatty acid transport protein
MPIWKNSTVAILSLCLVAPAADATNGYMSHGYGTTSKGMAGAGSALPQDTFSVYSNPAGLVRLGKRYDADLELFSPNRGYKANDDAAPPPNPSVPPGKEESSNDYFLIFGFRINLPLDDRSTIGIALAGGAWKTFGKYSSALRTIRQGALALAGRFKTAWGTVVSPIRSMREPDRTATGRFT